MSGWRTACSQCGSMSPRAAKSDGTCANVRGCKSRRRRLKDMPVLEHTRWAVTEPIVIEHERLCPLSASGIAQRDALALDYSKCYCDEIRDMRARAEAHRQQEALKLKEREAIIQAALALYDVCSTAPGHWDRPWVLITYAQHLHDRPTDRIDSRLDDLFRAIEEFDVVRRTRGLL